MSDAVTLMLLLEERIETKYGTKHVRSILNILYNAQ